MEQRWGFFFTNRTQQNIIPAYFIYSFKRELVGFTHLEI